MAKYFVAIIISTVMVPVAVGSTVTSVGLHHHMSGGYFLLLLALLSVGSWLMVFSIAAIKTGSDSLLLLFTLPVIFAIPLLFVYGAYHI